MTQKWIYGFMIMIYAYEFMIHPDLGPKNCPKRSLEAPGNPKQLADVTSHPLHKLPVACQVNKDYLEARCHRVTSWYNEFKGISMDSRNWGV